MKKIFKKKIVAVVLAISLIGSLGTVFAATDAGTQLRTWYNAQKAATFSSTTAEVVNYTLGKQAEEEAKVAQMNTDATDSLTSATDLEEGSTGRAINTARDSHISSLNAEKDLIIGGMGADFTSFINTQKGNIDLIASTLLNRGKGVIDAGIAVNVNEYINPAINNMNRSKTDAKTALSAAITAAKNSISSELDINETAAISALELYVDTKILEIEGALLTYKDGLVAQKIAYVQGEGARIEGEALSDLQLLVDAIDD